jgi:glycosyltransferase involved in cell wall biosynthesis
LKTIKKNRVLLINTQFPELYVSGFTNRFIGLWCYWKKNRESYNTVIHWLTNRSLWNKYFPGEHVPADVTVMKASLRYFKFTSRLLYPVYILYVYYRTRSTSIHVATSIINPLYLVRLFNLFNIPYCFTFASNSLDMAGYNSQRVKTQWQRLFSLAKNIEVLNPTNTINNYRGRKFVSPTSFPYITQFQDLSNELLTNPERSNNIVFCGTFVSQKNPLLAIHGFEFFLKNSGAEPSTAKLQMIGRGELLKEVKAELSRINKTFNRECIQLVPEDLLMETLATSKIFLSLQDYDNYPSQSLMEAMLFCNSVISLDNGDTSRLVDVNRKNLLLSRKDPEQLGIAIGQLLSDWKINLENKTLIEQKFSAEKFAEYFFDLHKIITDENQASQRDLISR